MLHPAIPPVAAVVLLAVGLAGFFGAIPLDTTVGNANCGFLPGVCATHSYILNDWNVTAWVNGTLNFAGIEVATSSYPNASYAATVQVLGSVGGPCTVTSQSGCAAVYSFPYATLTQTMATPDPNPSIGTFSIGFHKDLFGKVVHFDGTIWKGPFLLQAQVLFVQNGVPSLEYTDSAVNITLPGHVRTQSTCVPGNCFALDGGFTWSTNNRTVQFKDNSNVTGGAVFNVSWNFGDGHTGIGAVVNHSYSAIGTYTVTESITAKQTTAYNYLVQAVKANITISPAPTPPPPGCSNCNVPGPSPFHLNAVTLALIVGPLILFVFYLVAYVRGNPGAALAILGVGTVVSFFIGIIAQAWHLL